MSYRIKVVKEAPGIGTIKTFIIEKYQNSLLGGIKAEVTFTYSNGKKVEIGGDQEDVYKACIERIQLKKNKKEAFNTIEEFTKSFTHTVVGARTRIEKRGGLGEYYNPFSLGKPDTFLNSLLVNRNMTAKELGEKYGSGNGYIK